LPCNALPQQNAFTAAIAAPRRQSARLAAKCADEFSDMTSQAIRRKALLNNLTGCSPKLKTEINKRNILSRNKLPISVSNLRKLVAKAGIGCKTADAVGMVPISTP
jgi:hypothetical protein